MVTMHEVPRVVGVCTLTTRWLARELDDAPGVAVAAPLMTANLGIEELVRSVLRDNPIRVLVLCGRDSRLFRPGQSMLALARNGVRERDRRIIGAGGHQPYLHGLSVTDVETFRSQVRVVDFQGIVDPALLRMRIAAYACSSEGAGADGTARSSPRPRFIPLRPGGRRRQIQTTGEGFFVISADPVRRELTLRHYREDCTPAHEMRGRRAESMVLGLIGAGLIREPSHAAYLGAELTKAETAIRLGLDYFQDIPLRSHTSPGNGEVSASVSVADFSSFIARQIGLTGPELDASRPLGEQADLTSMQLIELTIAIEQECGIDLPDDIDLRKTSPAELFSADSAIPNQGLTSG
jgi:acyl carrier protein